MGGKTTPAHGQQFTERFTIAYPEHSPRQDDPNYVDFEHYHRLNRAAARCGKGLQMGTFDECRDAQGKPAPAPETGEQPGLELHHRWVEFALQNGINLERFEHKFPGISDPVNVGDWVESDPNFEWLCAWHHRGHAGAHTLPVSLWHSEDLVADLVS